MDSKLSIKEKLKEIFISYEFLEKECEVSDEALLFEDLGIDSLTFISMICDIEQEFLIAFSEDNLVFNEEIKFIDLVNIIDELRKK